MARLRRMVESLRAVLTETPPRPSEYADDRDVEKEGPAPDYTKLSTAELVKLAMDKDDDEAFLHAVRRKDITAKIPGSKEGNTFLHRLAQTSDTRRLGWVTDNDAAETAKNDAGETILHTIAKAHADFAKIDLAPRASMGKLKDKKGETPMSHLDRVSPGEADQYRRTHGRCPDDFNFDATTKHCKRVRS